MAHKRLGCQIVARKLCRDPTFTHDYHPVRHAKDFRNLRTDHDDGQTLCGELGHEFVHSGFRANVDTLGGLIKDDDLRLCRQPFGDDDLLLVAARKIADIGVQRGRAEVEPFGVFPSQPELLGKLQEAVA